MTDFMDDKKRDRVRAARGIEALGRDMGILSEPPAGEVLWDDYDEAVTLTADGWLIWTEGLQGGLYGRGLRASPELIAQLKGG